MIEIISGTVIDGDKIGRTLGFPTANIHYVSQTLPNAVFKVNVEIEGILYAGMGVHAVWKETFEVHAFDFDADIYGKEIEIYLLQEIRPNQKFDSLDLLAKQLAKDKKTIQSLTLQVLTFGTFDLVHEGHKHYLSEARKYGDTLITIVASDINIERIKGFPPKLSLVERIGEVEKLSISHEVIGGSEENPMKWLEIYAPNTICLGYDQRGPFVDALPEKIKELGLTTEIIRIEPFHPEKYKSSILKKET